MDEKILTADTAKMQPGLDHTDLRKVKLRSTGTTRPAVRAKSYEKEKSKEGSNEKGN